MSSKELQVLCVHHDCFVTADERGRGEGAGEYFLKIKKNRPRILHWQGLWSNLALAQSLARLSTQPRPNELCIAIVVTMVKLVSVLSQGMVLAVVVAQ